jgi:hypothetical protein
VLGNEPRIGENRTAYRVLVDKTERKRPLQRHRRRWEDNIRMDLKYIGWEGVKSIITKKMYVSPSTFKLHYEVNTHYLVPETGNFMKYRKESLLVHVKSINAVYGQSMIL